MSQTLPFWACTSILQRWISVLFDDRLANSSSTFAGLPPESHGWVDSSSFVFCSLNNTRRFIKQKERKPSALWWKGRREQFKTGKLRSRGRDDGEEEEGMGAKSRMKKNDVQIWTSLFWFFSTVWNVRDLGVSVKLITTTYFWERLIKFSVSLASCTCYTKTDGA